MEIGSAGAGSIAQNAPTQTGSAQQVVRAEQQAEIDAPSTALENEQSLQTGERVGSIVNTSV